MIEDHVLLELIHKYFTLICHGKLQDFKKPKIAEYVAEQGYPEFSAVLLRRNEAACKYIENLRATAQEKHLTVVSCYKTLDVEKFIDNNRSVESLKKALIDLDCYYRSVADSAAEIHKTATLILQRHDEMKKAHEEEKNKNDIANKKISQLSEEMWSVKRENDALRQYIKDYTLPDIANKILAADKVIKPIENSISDKALENNLITASDDVNSPSQKTLKSNVIEGAFRRLED